MEYGKSYVAFSTLVFTFSLLAMATHGLDLTLQRGWLRLMLWGLLLGLLMAAIIKLIIMCIFKSAQQDVLREWLTTISHWLRYDATEFIVSLVVVIIFAHAIVGVLDFVSEWRRVQAIANDFDQVLQVEIASYEQRADRFAGELARVNTQLEELAVVKSELEAKVTLLTAENASLTDTVKKASATGALPQGFGFPPR